MEITPSSSGCRPPASAPWLSSARPNGAGHPSLGFGNTNATWILPGTSFCRALGQGRLVVDTEQPLSPLPQGQPSTYMFLVFPKPRESRKSQSLTNLSLSLKPKIPLMALPHTLQLWKPARLLLELLTSADDLGRFFPQILATVPWWNCA